MTPFFNFKKYNELKERFREAWNIGSTAAFKGVYTFNCILNYLRKKTYYSTKQIILNFCIENSDLVNLNPSKLVSYLDDSNKILYRRGL